MKNLFLVVMAAICVIAALAQVSCLNKKSSEGGVFKDSGTETESVHSAEDTYDIYLDLPGVLTWYRCPYPYAIVRIKAISDEIKMLPPYIGASYKDEKEFVRTSCEVLAVMFNDNKAVNEIPELPDKGGEFDLYIYKNIINQLKDGDVIFFKPTRTRINKESATGFAGVDYYVIAATEGVPSMADNPGDPDETVYIKFVNGKAEFDNSIWKRGAFDYYYFCVYLPISERINVDKKAERYPEYRDAFMAAPDHNLESGVTLEEAIAHFDALALSRKLFWEVYELHRMKAN